MGRVKRFLGSSPSFSTPNFLSGPSKKGSTFMIAFDHNLILKYFRFLAKNKNSPFYMPIYYQTDLYTEKSHISCQLARKKERNVHLTFFIFETLAHTFFNDRKSIFQKFQNVWKNENSEISQTVLQKCITFKLIFKFWAA